VPLFHRLIYLLAGLCVLWLGWVMLKPASVPLAQIQVSGAQQADGYRITPLQPFNLTARVLAREDYRFDSGARWSPTDLALGWGPMADPQVLAKIKVTQSNRWYHWQTDDFPIPRREIETHSANMHMIPASEMVARILADVRPGERIALTGQLVRIDGDDGFRWVSSQSREDTGAGACELILVEQLSRLD
jgi:hypothetical protein